MTKRTLTLWFTFGGVVALVGGVIVYLKRVRPWHLHWGATPQEVASTLPGDDLILDPNWTATRAVTINAPPGAIWPWLVQMGYRRVGWYSYDRFDNDGIHVHRIIPEFQTLTVGDVMLTGSEGGFRVEAIDPGRTLVLKIDRASVGQDLEMSCVLALDPIDEQCSRLLIRLRGKFNGRVEKVWGRVLFDAGDFVMMRKMLLGIKERAEGRL